MLGVSASPDKFQRDLSFLGDACRSMDCELQASMWETSVANGVSRKNTASGEMSNWRPYHISHAELNAKPNEITLLQIELSTAHL